ncbi:MAG: TetR/AcrR family transcriptional regulator [Pseudomonadota bacterium]
MDRTTVHHHFGSQGLLHEAMIERIIDGYIAEAEKAISHAPQSIEQMVSMLFSDKFALPRFDRLLDEFETAARQDPKIASQVTRLYKTLEEQLVDFIVNSQADLPRAEARALGQSLYALLEGAYLLRSWGLPTSRLSVAREAAMRLVDHYKTTQSK